MIEIKNISKSYKTEIENEVLHNISATVNAGEFVILLGQSGSGKTTLLNIIAGLLPPSDGEIIIDGKSIYELSDAKLCEFRSKHIGFVFQNYLLENRFTAEENVLVPLLLNPTLRKAERMTEVHKALKKVGLEGKNKAYPRNMSGGECQRVSIARALVNNPEIIIADEPTGNLDSENGIKIMELLKAQTSEGKTVIVVTHNENYSEYADKVFRISDGKLI